MCRCETAPVVGYLAFWSAWAATGSCPVLWRHFTNAATKGTNWHLCRQYQRRAKDQVALVQTQWERALWGRNQPGCHEISLHWLCKDSVEKSSSGSFCMSGVLTCLYRLLHTIAPALHKECEGFTVFKRCSIPPSDNKYSKSSQRVELLGWSKLLLTRILSQSMMVSSLWAMVRTVHSLNLSRIVCWIRLSVLKEQGTQHLNTHTHTQTHSLPVHPWAGGLLNTGQWLINGQVDSRADTKVKGQQGFWELKHFYSMLTFSICASHLIFT